MFKKTLVALALAGLSTSAMAVEMAATGQLVSAEGFAAGKIADGKVAATAVTAKLGAEYTIGDTIVFTLSGGSFADTGYKLVTSASAPAAGTDPEIVTWGLLNSTATTLTFRATNITAGTGSGKTTGVTYSLEGATPAELSVKVTSVAKDSKVVVTSDAKTSTGIAIDVVDNAATAANEDAATLLTGVQQLAIKETAGKGKVDVGNGRLTFVTIADAGFSIAYDENSAPVGDIALVTTDVTINGDFTGVAALTECGVDTNCAAGATAADNVNVVIAKDKQSAKMTLTGAARDLKFAFTLPTVTADKVALSAPQSFTATVLAKYDVNATILNAATVSTWTLNGANEQIEFMPFSDQYFQSITVTNSGDVEGAITIDFIADGKLQSKMITAKATAKTITNISAEVKALAAEFGITDNAKVRVIVNSPEGDISVSGVYYHKADKDRVKTK